MGATASDVTVDRTTSSGRKEVLFFMSLFISKENHFPDTIKEFILTILGLVSVFKP